MGTILLLAILITTAPTLCGLFVAVIANALQPKPRYRAYRTY